MYSLILGLVLFILYGVFEYRRHQRFRKRIPVIIHVNGTRGKSSVTRLIAAGLRANYKNVLAKTTGSAPVFIFEDGNEVPIQRPYGANIKEQIKIIRYAANRGVEYLVLECMAVTPEYQWVSEHAMVKADISVLTNSRLDHLDVMGPGLKNVTLSLCNTIPIDGITFTSEKKMLPIIKKQAAKLNSKVLYADETRVPLEKLGNFNHIEHRENVALALDVCEYCKIDREKALEKMYKAKPDIGAAEIFTYIHKDKKIFFVHSFAANDPESTKFLIDYVRQIHLHLDCVAIVLNTRADRMFRSKQLLQMMPQIEFNELYLIGDQPQTVKKHALKKGLPLSKIHPLGWITGEMIIEQIEKLKSKEILLFGIGNIGGNGKIIMNYFKERN